MNTIARKARSAGLLGRTAAFAAFGLLAAGAGTTEAALPGYEVKVSSEFTVPPQTQRGTTVTCPTGKVVVGGGAYIYNDLTPENAVNLNSSYPSDDGRSWVVYVNNQVGNTPNRYKAYAICVNKPSGYVVQKSTVKFSGSSGPVQLGHTKLCQQEFGGPTLPFPTLTVIGGGVYSDSTNVGVNINSSAPEKNGLGWTAYMNDLGSQNSQFTVKAICAENPFGWKIERAYGSSRSGTFRTPATVTCSSGVPLSGGAWVNSNSAFINLGSSYPSSATSWRVMINNTPSGEDTSFQAVVVCAPLTDPPPSPQQPR